MFDGTLDPSRLEAVIFDLDGTLYQQKPLQRRILVRLLRAYALHPRQGVHTARILYAYRKAQEELRAGQAGDGPPVDLSQAQLRIACQHVKVGANEVAACVTRWMEHEPLPLLASCIQPGVLEFLHACQSRRLGLGVLSDYPAEAKLAALGLRDFFDVVMSAQSSEVGVFKPHPRGLLVVARKLGVAPDQALYVGDRASVDAPAAAAAGMPCFLVTSGFAQLSSWLNRPSTSAERPMLPVVPNI